MALSKEQKELRLAELRSFIQLHKDDKGPLMPIMQKAQELFGYLSLEPKGQYVIGVCTGTACYVKGAAAVLEEVEKQLGVTKGRTSKDGVFTIQDTRCLGCCGLAPVMVINDDVYGRLVPADVPGILAKYKNEG